MLALPLFIGVIFAISYFGNRSSEARINELAKDLKNVSIIDQSGLIREDVVKSAGLKLLPTSDKDTLREQVRNQKTEALIVYPSDIKESKKYEVYLSSDDFSKSSSVSSLGDSLLETSIFAPLGSTDIIALAKDGAEAKVTTYRDGRQTAGIYEYIVPGLIIVLFYIIFFFSVGYMLSSVGEEKENRSMEMVLTYVKSRTLIVGKLLAVILVTLTQILFFALLAGLGLLAFSAMGNQLALPAGFDISQIVFDPLTIFFGLGFLFGRLFL